MKTETLDAFFTREELLAFGFRSVGHHVRVSRKCSLYAISGQIGNHVRIDDFCILKGQIEIGNHVHICAFASLSGARGVVRLLDFCTLANRVSLYTGSDDYRADALSSSTVPEQYLTTITGDVILGRASLVGAHSVILPGTTLGDAASVGALCLVHGAVPAGAIAVCRGAGLAFKGTRDVQRILKMADEVENGAGNEG